MSILETTYPLPLLLRPVVDAYSVWKRLLVAPPLGDQRSIRYYRNIWPVSQVSNTKSDWAVGTTQAE